jgi:hypothetical protein
LGATEVWFRHIEPKTTRENLRAWRLSVPLDEFRKIGKKYDDAGIEKIAFTTICETISQMTSSIARSSWRKHWVRSEPPRPPL